MLVALCTGISAHLYSIHAEYSSHEGGVSRCVPLQSCIYMKRLALNDKDALNFILMMLHELTKSECDMRVNLPIVGASSQ